MSGERTKSTARSNKPADQRTPNAPESGALDQETPLPSLMQQGKLDRRLLTPATILQLQRTIGNRATAKIFEKDRPKISTDVPVKPVQRQLLITFAAHDNEPIDVEMLGLDKPALIRYAKLMKDDSQIVAKGEAIKSKAEAIKKLKNAILNAGVEAKDVEFDFFKRIKNFDNPELWGGLTLDNLPAGWKEKIVNAYLDGTGSTTIGEFGFASNNHGDFIDIMDGINGNKITPLLRELIKIQGNTVQQLANCVELLPASWKETFGFSLYNVARFSWYDNKHSDYEQAFMELIADVNAGNIQSYEFVTKYPGGAEFTVRQPEAMRNKYQNKAVVHTHYNGNAGQPVYGHTKPANATLAGGYGFTIVNLPNLLAVPDTNKPYDQL